MAVDDETDKDGSRYPLGTLQAFPLVRFRRKGTSFPLTECTGCVLRMFILKNKFSALDVISFICFTVSTARGSLLAWAVSPLSQHSCLAV